MTEQHKDRDSNRPETKRDSDPDDNTMIGREDLGPRKVQAFRSKRQKLWEVATLEAVLYRMISSRKAHLREAEIPPIVQ